MNMECLIKTLDEGERLLRELGTEIYNLTPRMEREINE